MTINALDTVNSNLTEVYGSQVLFDGLSISITQAQRSTKERKYKAYVGTLMVDGIFGSLSTTFFCCFDEKLVLKVWANSHPCLKSLLCPLHFPYMDSYVTIVWTEWL